MRKSIFTAGAFAAGSIALLTSTSALAASDQDISALKDEIKNMRQAYETRINELEAKLEKVEQKQQAGPTPSASTSSIESGRKVLDNTFNPSIGVILNGRVSNFSRDAGDIAGFAIGEEGERHNEGVAVDESEINFSSNVDDKFYGSVTAAIAREDGEDIIELEEAYVKTLPGTGLPTGLSLKAGRALWALGYLNDHHTHSDDFADRPLPYRAFLNNAFNDDGIEASYTLPTDIYTEIGGGLFRGDDFPGGNADGENPAAYSFFARIGDDISDNQSWRLGGYMLKHNDVTRSANEDSVLFTGDSDIYAADLRYTWAPTGNSANQEVLLQGEYFWRDEQGTYEDITTGTGAIPFDDNASGWYAQGVYKFMPQWRTGLRYTALNSPDLPSGLVGSQLDPSGHDPYITSVMADWTNSEFSRVRLQYNNDHVAEETDNQFILQYIMSLGAHPAHSY